MLQRNINNRRGISSVEACGAFVSLLIDTSGYCRVIWECWAHLEELGIKGIEVPDKLKANSEAVGVRISLVPSDCPANGDVGI